ncbi:hypothetical protein BDA99DRAFT_430420 [Phascolomyces articulosus]|uniref:Uncharacterized protein n=1 Tax=Phascolomyces articulosus TaxID=60185 RepID=A0AAD5KQD3_9FUNG|nr:hypothetical protein BDA99DRAFT_430420 [Phascolomyces articulosus]
MQNGDEVFFTALLFISNIHCWLPINLHHYFHKWKALHYRQITKRNCNDNQHLSRNHVISCFNVHTLLNIPYVVPDLISFVLNSLPTKRPTSDSKERYWKYIRSRLTRLMKEIDRLCHDDDLRENDSEQSLSIKNDFIMWIDQPNTDSAHRSPSTSQYTLTQHSSD